MKKYIVLAVIIILIILYFIARYIENNDSNHNRHRSNSIAESLQNNLLLGKYRVINNTDSLFFTIEEAWVEKSSLYVDDKFSEINSDSQNFIIVVKYKEREKYGYDNYSIDWIIGIDDTLVGNQGKYFSFYKSKFEDKVQLKIIILKEQFNFNNPNNKVYKTLEFEKVQ
jgi:hypothetical protein